jgi:hypothetical protein
MLERSLYLIPNSTYSVVRIYLHSTHERRHEYTPHVITILLENAIETFNSGRYEAGPRICYLTSESNCRSTPYAEIFSI